MRKFKKRYLITKWSSRLNRKKCSEEPVRVEQLHKENKKQQIGYKPLIEDSIMSDEKEVSMKQVEDNWKSEKKKSWNLRITV